MAMMAGLSDRQLLLVTGKGGVGKSSVAAALALASARDGRRTLVCEINARERIAPLLGHPEVGPELRELEPGLFSVNVRPPEALKEYALMVVRFKAVYQAVFENRLVRSFLRFVPSLAELVMLGKILFHAREEVDGRPRFETIVIDAPATGHALSFFSVPRVLLDTVPPGPLANEARIMDALLTDAGRTAAVLVCLPEDMPVNETLQLARELEERVGIQPAAVVLNNFVQPRFDEAERERLSAVPELREVVAARNARVELSQEALTRLRDGQPAPVHTLDRIHHADFDRGAIEQLSAALTPLWKGTS